MVGRATKTAIIMEGKITVTIVVVETKNGVPAKGVMQVVRVGHGGG